MSLDLRSSHKAPSGETSTSLGRGQCIDTHLPNELRTKSFVAETLRSKLAWRGSSSLRTPLALAEYKALRERTLSETSSSLLALLCCRRARYLGTLRLSGTACSSRGNGHPCRDIATVGNEADCAATETPKISRPKREGSNWSRAVHPWLCTLFRRCFLGVQTLLLQCKGFCFLLLCDVASKLPGEEPAR